MSNIEKELIEMIEMIKVSIKILFITIFIKFYLLTLYSAKLRGDDLRIVISSKMLFILLIYDISLI